MLIDIAHRQKGENVFLARFTTCWRVAGVKNDFTMARIPRIPQWVAEHYAKERLAS